MTVLLLDQIIARFGIECIAKQYYLPSCVYNTPINIDKPSTPKEKSSVQFWQISNLMQAVTSQWNMI
jgi:hypothetical protein